LDDELPDTFSILHVLFAAASSGESTSAPATDHARACGRYGHHSARAKEQTQSLSITAD
jgi:hypothetical protein